MPNSSVLIIRYDDTSHVICTPDDLETFHLYSEATGQQTWSGVMSMIGREEFLRLWETYHGDFKLTNGLDVLFQPEWPTSDDDTYDLQDPNTWKYSEESPLSSFAFSKLEESDALTDPIIEELGGHKKYGVLGIYYTQSAEEIQIVLARHGITAEIDSEIPYERYNSDERYFS